MNDFRDQDGKFVIREMAELVRQQESGWVEYRWINPKTKTVAYVERMGDYYAGVGVYKPENVNENTVSLISGSPESDDTYLQAAYDLAAVLNNGDNLRILPIVGIGGPQNIRDVRSLRGIDIGLTETNVLNNFRRSNETLGSGDGKIVYITKLFPEEIHLVARTSTSLEQLRGLKVNLDARGSGTSYAMRDIFKALGIEIQEVSMSQAEAFEKLKSGEIAATVLLAGKPVRSMSKLSFADRLHFVPIPYSSPLFADYLPTAFKHDDYPELVPAGQSIDTVAVSAVLIAFNWPKTNIDRYGRVQRFIDAFFPKIAEFGKPPRHSKWREVNLAAQLPGWTRFEAAQDWLDNHRAKASANQVGVRQVAPTGEVARRGDSNATQPIDSALYQEFLQWKQMRRAK
jgi:TRAP-type uncharacterized transport system substrate-binding protein